MRKETIQKINFLYFDKEEDKLRKKREKEEAGEAEDQEIEEDQKEEEEEDEDNENNEENNENNIDNSGSSIFIWILAQFRGAAFHILRAQRRCGLSLRRNDRRETWTILPVKNPPSVGL